MATTVTICFSANLTWEADEYFFIELIGVSSSARISLTSSSASVAFGRGIDRDWATPSSTRLYAEFPAKRWFAALPLMSF